MTETIHLAGTAPIEALFFKTHPIAYVLFDGVPWFSLADLCAAMNWNDYAAEVVHSCRFPENAKRTAEELTDDGWQPITVLSPVGVWLWGTHQDPGKTQSIASWARREARRLCPNPRDGDPAMFLTLDEDGNLPPRPMKYSGRRSEWLDLRESSTCQQALIDRRDRELRQAHADAYAALAAISDRGQSDLGGR